MPASTLAAEEFGLHSMDVRRLSAALFEVGCQLTLPAPETRAELALADVPLLQVQFHVAAVERMGGLVALERSQAFSIAGVLPRRRAFVVGCRCLSPKPLPLR